MPIPLSDLAVELLKIIGPVALSGITWAIGHLALLLKARTGSTTAATAVMQLNDLFVSVVTELQQTIVQELKAKSGGTLTDEDRRRIKQLAVDRIRTMAGPGMLEIALKSLGIDGSKLADFISTRLESTVFAIKSGATPALPPFLAGPPPGASYNQQPGQVQPDGSTSTGLPPFLSGPPTPYKGVVPIPGKK